MVIGCVFPNKPALMGFIQRDDVVEELSATTSHPPLGYSIGKGRQLHLMTTMAIPLLKSSTHTIR
jgi:hypothetical protein